MSKNEKSLDMAAALEAHRRQGLSRREKIDEFVRTPLGVLSMVSAVGVIGAAVWGVWYWTDVPDEFIAGESVPDRFVDVVNDHRDDQRVYEVGGDAVVVDLFADTPEVVMSDIRARIDSFDVSEEGAFEEMLNEVYALTESTGKSILLIHQKVGSCDGDEYSVGWGFSGHTPAAMQQNSCQFFETLEEAVEYAEAQRATMFIPTEVELFVIEGPTFEVNNFLKESNRLPSAPEGYEGVDGEEWVEPETWEGESSEDWQPSEEQMQSHAGDA